MEIKLLHNSLKLSDEELQQVEDLAGLNYQPEKIAVYLSVPKDDFMREWYNKESQVRIFYDRGSLVAVFEINQKQGELAKAGNITAAQIFLKESEKVHIDNLRNQSFFNV